MTRRGIPENFAVDPHAPTFSEENIATGKGLAGGNPLQRVENTGYLRAPLSQPLFQVADLEPNHDGQEGAYRERLANFLARGPVEIEIGFGDGVFLLDRAHKHPERQFIGFELRWHLLRPVLKTAANLSNLWVSADDARYALARSLPAGCADVLHVLLPDPWWKKRHQAKRIFNAYTMQLMARVLAPGAILHVRTDVTGYASFIEQIVSESGLFAPHAASFGAQFADGVPTTREAWCYEHGFPIFTFYFQRNDVAVAKNLAPAEA